MEPRVPIWTPREDSTREYYHSSYLYMDYIINPPSLGQASQGLMNQGIIFVTWVFFKFFLHSILQIFPGHFLHTRHNSWGL